MLFFKKKNLNAASRQNATIAELTASVVSEQRELPPQLSSNQLNAIQRQVNVKLVQQIYSQNLIHYNIEQKDGKNILTATLMVIDQNQLKTENS